MAEQCAVQTSVMVVDEKSPARESFARRLGENGYLPLKTGDFDRALTAAKVMRPTLIVVNLNVRSEAAGELCRTLKRDEATCGIPILGVSARLNLGQLEDLAGAGLNLCRGDSLVVEGVGRKVDELLKNGATTMPEAGGPISVPADLAAAYWRLRERARPLGDMAEIFSGVLPRHRRYRRAAPPGPEWRAVFTEDRVSRYGLAAPDQYLQFNRLGLVRVPALEEYAQPEKVLVRRGAPPLVAAVDRQGLPAGAGVYAVVPARGLECGYLAALLNSRLFDFYIHRLRPPREHEAGLFLRSTDLAALPVVLPAASTQRRVAACAARLAELIAVRGERAGLRAGGPYLKLIDEVVFKVNGFTRDEIAHLAALGF